MQTTFFTEIVPQERLVTFFLAFLAFETLLMSLYYLPQIIELVIKKSKGTIDNTFENFTDYFHDSVWQAKDELFFGSIFVSEIFTLSKQILELSKAGVKVNVLLFDKEGECLPAVVKIMGGGTTRVESKLQFAYDSLRASFIDGNIENLEIRVIDYAFTFGFLAIDREKETGFIDIQLFGYDNVNLSKRPYYKCHKKSNWFSYYSNQINALWEIATPISTRFAQPPVSTSPTAEPTHTLR